MGGPGSGPKKGGGKKGPHDKGKGKAPEDKIDRERRLERRVACRGSDRAAHTRDAIAEQDADRSASKSEQARFHHKDGEDVPVPAANGLQNADLFCPF